MPRPGEKTKKKKKRRTPKGKSKVVYVREKSGKHYCSICGRIMHGMPHGKTNAGVGKLSKSARRPTAFFAGQLCNKCRASAVEEALKVEEGFKKIEDVDLRLRNFAKQIAGKMGK